MSRTIVWRVSIGALIFAIAITAGCVSTGNEYHEGKVVDVKYLPSGDTQLIFADGYTVVLCHYQPMQLNKSLNLSYCRLSGNDCYTLAKSQRTCL